MTRAHWIVLAVAAVLIGVHVFAIVAVARAVCPFKPQHQEHPKP